MNRSTMRPLNPPIDSLRLAQVPKVVRRTAARGVITVGSEMLLMYTERYDDFSLPGGGIGANEDVVDALVREIAEETGARGVRDIAPYGIYEELRPSFRDPTSMVHMFSYCFTCGVDLELGEPKLEVYERANGMKAMWVDVYDAIAHNERTVSSGKQAGLSIERETYLLRLVHDELLGRARRAPSSAPIVLPGLATPA